VTAAWCATTTTLNLRLRSMGCSVPRAVLCNNEIWTTSRPKPGVPQRLRLVQGKANAIAPGKQPLSRWRPRCASTDARATPGHRQPGCSRTHHHRWLRKVPRVIASSHGLKLASAVAPGIITADLDPISSATQQALSPEQPAVCCTILMGPVAAITGRLALPIPVEAVRRGGSLGVAGPRRRSEPWPIGE